MAVRYYSAFESVLIDINSQFKRGLQIGRYIFLNYNIDEAFRRYLTDHGLRHDFITPEFRIYNTKENREIIERILDIKKEEPWMGKSLTIEFKLTKPHRVGYNR